MITLIYIVFGAVSLVGLLLLYTYLRSRIEMKGWMSVLENHFKQKYNKIKMKEDGNKK